MIIDFAKTPQELPPEADYCIIGAGAAGLTLARELTRSSASKVVLLESGSWQLDTPTQELYSGPSSGTFLTRKRNAYLMSSRLRFFGGTTNHWTGWVYPFDEIDFRVREWVPHSGWPFERESLSPYYARAAQFLKLQSLVLDDIPASQRTASFLDADCDFQERVFQICPRRLGLELREELSAVKNLDIVLNANVTGIVPDPAKQAVSFLRVKTLAGSESTLRARTYVLACGGIENARLLLASTEGSANGLGNEHDLVGRYFSDHPHVPIGYIALSQRPLAQRYREAHFEALGYNLLSVLHVKPEAMRRDNLLNCTIQLQAIKRAGLPDDVQRIGVALARPEKTALEGEQENDVLSVFMRSEQIPNPESRVTLSSQKDSLGAFRAQLQWQVAASDLECARRAVDVLTRNLGALGIGRVFSRVSDGQLWPPNARGGNHHMGTTRMHKDPHHGVVDEHCRVHAIENLYIAGSSVFPTTSSVNPTLTIIALALRLADHLRQGKGGGSP